MEWKFEVGDKVKLIDKPTGSYPHDYFGLDFPDRIHTIKEQRLSNGKPIYFLEGYVLFVIETDLEKIN